MISSIHIILLQLLLSSKLTFSFTLFSHPQKQHVHLRNKYSISSLSSSKSTSTVSKDIEKNDESSERKDTSSFFFANNMEDEVIENTSTSKTTSHNNEKIIERELGSQELLMLPRQYQPKEKVKAERPIFPSMSHICSIKLSKTPSITILNKALSIVAKEHPLMHCVAIGGGEPIKRIDLFQMVREGNPDPCKFILSDDDELVNEKSKVKIVHSDDIEDSWKKSFGELLDDGISVYEDSNTLLWNVELHTTSTSSNINKEDDPCILLFQWNHAISDQSTVQVAIDHLLSIIAALENNEDPPTLLHREKSNVIPPSLEESLVGNDTFAKKGIQTIMNLGTIKYILGKAREGLYNPVILPDHAKNDSSSKQRKSVLQFRTLSSDTTKSLIKQCRKRNITLTHLLTSVMSIVSSNYIPSDNKSNKQRNYKILQSLDMRRYEKHSKDSIITPCCHAGSMDIMSYNIKDYTKINKTNKDIVWNLAKEGKKQTDYFITNDGPYHAIKEFDFATTIADMTNLVHLTSMSSSSKGRAYTAGVVNAGVYEKLPSCCTNGANLEASHGDYNIEDIYFATSHVNTGCLYPMSVVTINNEMKFTFHPVDPIVTNNENQLFADDYINLLTILAEDDDDTNVDSNPITSAFKNNKNDIPAIGATLLGLGLNIPHIPAWNNFLSNVSYMKEAIGAEQAQDFFAAINFWVFFAVGHAILQPILYLSDVLHGSPGPLIGDLVPATFILANVVFLTAFSISQEIRNVLNIVLFSLFLNYVGVGLDGKGGLGDYNLAINDSYEGKIVKGCPAYDDVKLDSMKDFDITKYQGKWYEHKFHDWTQFKEVYDTTLDIKLTPDGKGWIDDFAVKGPAPNAAKLSWDKSPVANGAHYFLFGRIDDNDPPGVLRESGFGVEFPNYIVDVQKDSKTGEYTEAIQFQCLERGGVRVFEGINFMSRNPVMTDIELKNMHERAKQAGMYPYGASEEQMHLVERRDVGAPDIDNSWQQMWRNLGVDKLLELLTESIEDGGR